MMREENGHGVKDAAAKTSRRREISSSTALAFSAQLASLISRDGGSRTTAAGRARPSKRKADLFTQHRRRPGKKRTAAAAEEEGEGEGGEDGGQRHKTEVEIGGVDAAALQRSRRRMEEKARIYAAMRRGDYVGPEDGRDERTLVDFDRKWAEREASGQHDDDDDDDATPSGSDAGDGDDGQLVEYQDEFGRQRKGTRTEVAREERRRRIQANASHQAEQFSARPQMPTNLIRGDTVQYNAFNPDQVTTDKIADLAKKRDRSATPPEEVHYDADAEVRTRGTGFYSFSKDAEGRKKEMEALERERLQTERERRERDARKEKRRQEIEERRRKIAEQRTKIQADRFLADFDLGIGGDNAGN